MRTGILLVGLSSALSLAGCQTAREAEIVPPTARIEGLGMTGECGVLWLCFTNPNPVPLVASSSTHKLMLGEKSMGTIDDEEPIGLPPLGTVAHSIVLSPKVTLAAQDYLQNNPGVVHAQVKSALHVTLAEQDVITLKSLCTGLVNTP
ncbi:MAG: hypothetical protein H2172_15580 [Opitutus sp.]|nr:hypothetical protein [Opitutus sp.]MCS6246056.1 hypothetical protein [Opitutus sp.]MCS6273728.1 hypothetical protein [Opitutus sp.]MCS6276217.1 hypothetical protein [Opitutus sp.]MCS6301311.1 hypothetical protein [Opitutus sp.]